MKISDGWHRRSVPEVLATLGSDSEKGLDKGRVAVNRRKWGRNDLWYTGGPAMFFSTESGFSVLGYVFMAVAAFSASAFDKCHDAWIVGLAIFIGAFFTALCYVITGLICQKHASKWIPICTVIRNNDILKIRADSLVLGDIILLKEGDRIPADIKLIASENITVIEPPFAKRKGIIPKSTVGAAITAEGASVPEDFIYAGSEIVSGSGRAVVCAVGADTRQGRIGKIRLAQAKDTAKLAILRKRGVATGAFAMIFSFAAVAIGVFSPITASDFVGMFLVFLAFAVSAGGELVPAICCLAYYLLINDSETSGLIIRDAAGIDYICGCDGIAAENPSFMKSDKTELKSVWSSGGNVDIGAGRADELFSLMLAGTDYGKGKYGKGVLLAVEEHTAGKSDTQKYIVTAMNTKPVLEHRIIGATQYSLFISGGEHYFAVTGSIEDVISKCTKLRVNGRDVSMRRENLSEILGAAAEALKVASSIIAVAVRVSPYNSMKRLSVLTSDLSFVGFIAMETPAHGALPSGLAHLRSEKVPFVMFTDGSGEDINFARKLGIIRNRSDLVFADSSDDALMSVLAENSDGGAVYVSSENRISAVLESARKMGKRLVYVGSEELVQFTDFAVVSGGAVPRSGAYLTTQNGGEVSAVLNAFAASRKIFSRLTKAYTYLFVSSVIRAVYSLTLLFGLRYVYPSVILAWGLVLDAVVAGLMIGVKKKQN